MKYFLVSFLAISGFAQFKVEANELESSQAEYISLLEAQNQQLSAEEIGPVIQANMSFIKAEDQKKTFFSLGSLVYLVIFMKYFGLVVAKGLFLIIVTIMYQHLIRKALTYIGSTDAQATAWISSLIYLAAIALTLFISP